MVAPRISKVERIMVDVPFTPRCAEWNPLLVSRWRLAELWKLTADAPDLVGWGESLLYYNAAPVTEAAVARVQGANPFELLGDDTLGVGLQMAVYDLAAKAAGVPVNRLFGLPQVREWCPLGWWNHDMPPEVLAEEAKEAVAQGYRAHKFKSRPWLDVYEQVAQVSAVTPDGYKIDIDWNDMLLNAANAAPVLQELDRQPKVALYEGPIPQRDVEGYAHLRRKVSKPIAIHLGLPPFPTAIEREVCDGFVVAGGVAETLRQGMLSATFEKSFFLQQVGTGITTAMVAHLGSVLTHARWPAITCMNNYTDDLLTEPLTIRHGSVKTPEGPGLGVTVDEDAVERLRATPTPDGRFDVPMRRHIITVTWPGGRRVHYAYMQKPRPSDASPFAHLQFAQGARPANEVVGRQCWEDFLTGNHPVQERGVRLSFRVDDGTAEWADLYERCHRAPVWEEA
jgi:L-alanine-DL-glutamate epimerase and related enzymes of enolase superfamily